MIKVLALATNTYREAIRQKLLYSLIFFTLVMIGASHFIAQLSLGGVFEKIIKDVGLFAIFFFGVFLSISMGVSLVFKEVDRRTIYTILSKPISRFGFVLGKFLGLALVVGLMVVLMMAALYGVLSFYSPSISWVLLKSAYLMFLEFCILISICLVFSSYSSSLMSTLFSFSIFVVGHVSDNLANALLTMARNMRIESKWPEVVGNIVEFFNLDMFIVHTKIVHGIPVPGNYLFNATMLAVCWVLFFLTASMLLFRRKDLK
jgi:ABC-type transport system involved in multi-copper enzyme maturation permease subunit